MPDEWKAQAADITATIAAVLFGFGAQQLLSANLGPWQPFANGLGWMCLGFAALSLYFSFK